MLELFDSHCHLTDAGYSNPEETIRRAHENGVRLILTVGLDRLDCQAVVKLAEANDGVYAGIGIHPHEADKFRAGPGSRQQAQASGVLPASSSSESEAVSREPSAVGDTEDDIEFLRRLAQNSKVKAIGETGLDFFKGYAAHDNQRVAFHAHIELARELGLPMILHIRDAYPEALAILKEHGYHEGVMHCYSGDRAFALEAVQLGFYIAFSGSLTYSQHKLPDAARAVPLGRLLVETDAPFLTPAPYRGKMRNEPALVRFTLQELARLRNLPAEEMARITTENAKRVFRIV
jgi:TatD DNase family protein